MVKLYAGITGGTIDAKGEGYAPDKDCEFYEDGRSAAWEIIKTVWTGELWYDKPFTKDSKYITDEDIGRVAAGINSSDCKKVLLTWGTSKAVHDGKLLKALVKDKTKRILMVGAMWPLELGPLSEGDRNLRFACSNLISSDEPGVFIVGKQYGSDEPKIFDINNVRKNLERLVFEEINPAQLRQK